ncbi:hypothetical protein [Cryobacterium lactosi]|nr:hypothetical protein [Cryobacterium lactosi]
MNDEELRKLATKRLKARRDFWNFCGVTEQASDEEVSRLTRRDQRGGQG